MEYQLSMPVAAAEKTAEVVGEVVDEAVRGITGNSLKYL